MKYNTDPFTSVFNNATAVNNPESAGEPLVPTNKLTREPGRTSLKDFIEIKHTDRTDNSLTAKSEQLDCDNDFNKASSNAFNKLQTEYQNKNKYTIRSKITLKDLFSNSKFTDKKRNHINELRRLLCNEK